ncbi:MAG: NAD(P)-binding protein [Acidimicrobiales bacterium]|nr:NAD(P)-binding protein [Acidimicrobiales bacterium]
MTADVAIVGAGLAGLAAAIRLCEAGRSVVVFERADGPGGRVRTDVVDGYRLDRGFQILLDAYPEAQQLLRYDVLDLRPFQPGVELRIDGSFHRVGDPFRRPADLVPTVRAPVGSLTDKLRILRYRRRVTRQSLAQLWSAPEQTAQARLEDLGFSSTMIERFFQPLFAGITLDPTLSGSSRVLDFVFRMLAIGDAVVPAGGMGQIGEHLLARLPDDTVHLQTPVAKVDGNGILLAGGERVDAGAVIVATGMTEAAELAGVDDRGWNGVTSCWFSSNQPVPIGSTLVLNSTGSGPVNSVANLAAVSPMYAPTGRQLVVASSVATPARSAPDIADQLRAQLRDWYGPMVEGWDLLRVDRVDRAQPRQPPGQTALGITTAPSGAIVAGDHRHDASINGALRSGAEAAAAAHRLLTGA